MARSKLTDAIRHVRQLLGAPQGADLNDRQLLDRFSSSRDEGAFATLVRRHGPLVLGVCRRILANPHDADDAFQATFLVLVHKAASIGWRESIGNWLSNVAYHVATRARRGAARRRKHEQQASTMSPTEPTSSLDFSALEPILDDELHRLPEKYRMPLLLCYLQGKSRDEAAGQLGWTAGEVKGRLERGRDLLRGRLARRGLALAALVPAVLEQGASAAAPEDLVSATVKAAAGGAVAAPVNFLVKGALHTMFWAKVRRLMLLTMACCLSAVVIGLPIYQAWATNRAPADGAAVTEQGRKELPEEVRGQKVLMHFAFYSPNAPAREETTRAEEVRAALKKANVSLVKVVSEEENKGQGQSYYALLLLDCQGQVPKKALAGLPHSGGGIVFQDGHYQEGLPFIADGKAMIPARWGYVFWGGTDRRIGGRFDRDMERLKKIPGLKMQISDTNDGTPGSAMSAQLTAEPGKKTLLEIFLLTGASFELKEAPKGVDDPAK